jgi:hypothetical protein
MRSFKISLFLTKYLVDQIKKDSLGRACDTHGVQARYIRGFGGEM